MTKRLALVLLTATALASGGCGGGEEDSDDDAARAESGQAAGATVGEAPQPTRFARDLGMTTCLHNDLPGIGVGTGSQVAGGLTCAEVPRLIDSFTTGFTDENLTKPLVDRGRGWTCWQHVSPSGFSVREVCWNEGGEVFVFKKG